MKAFLLVVIVCCHQLLCDHQLEESTDKLVEEFKDQLVEEFMDQHEEFKDKLVDEFRDQLIEFTTPVQVKATDSEITLGVTLLNIKREKSIAELFQVQNSANSSEWDPSFQIRN